MGQSGRHRRSAGIILLVLSLAITGSLRGYPQDAPAGLPLTKADTAAARKSSVASSVTRQEDPGYLFERKSGPAEVLSPVPGLLVQPQYGDDDARFSIRGYGSRTNSGTGGVRILMDNIPESDPGGEARPEAIDLNALGRIEVFRSDIPSLFPVNTPGGAVNFVSYLDFDRSSVTLFNEAGSSGRYKNGFRAAVKTDRYRFLASYSYVNFDGYRQHSNGYRHILNLALRANLTAHSTLTVLGYLVDGSTKLPGSLTREEFSQDPMQASPLSLARDDKRITTKGRLGLRYNVILGKRLNHAVEVTAYTNMGFIEQADALYRIINRYGIGLNGKYTCRSLIGGRNNELTVGGDLFTLPDRTEYYQNKNGERAKMILQVITGHQTNKALFLSDKIDILKDRLSLLLAGRYDHLSYVESEETIPSRTDKKSYPFFTPRLALGCMITPEISVGAAYSCGTDAPSSAELVRPDTVFLVNQAVPLFNRALSPRRSQNFELAFRGSLPRDGRSFLRYTGFEATLFNCRVSDEIIPYDTIGMVCYRNAAWSNRLGFELGARLEIIRGLDLRVAYTYSHFTYLNYDAKTTGRDSLGNLVSTYRDFTGNMLPGIPGKNLFVSLSFTRSVCRHLDIYARASYQGIGGMWVNDENSDRTGSCDLLNGMIGLRLQFGKFSAMASGGVNNILDEVYTGYTNTNEADRRYYFAGAPRNHFLSLNVGYLF